MGSRIEGRVGNQWLGIWDHKPQDRDQQFCLGSGIRLEQFLWNQISKFATLLGSGIRFLCPKMGSVITSLVMITTRQPTTDTTQESSSLKIGGALTA